MKNSAPPPPPRPRRKDPRPRRPGLLGALLRWLGFILLGGIIIGTLALGAYMYNLDRVIRAQFEGKQWALPARVYARPLELFPGMAFSADDFARELEMLHYRSMLRPDGPGTYARDKETFEVNLRGFTFWDKPETDRGIRVKFDGKTVAALGGLEGTQEPELPVRLEPIEIAAIYPSHHEDRILVKLEEIPPVLLDALIEVEDRAFYEHFGINPKGIVRALLANLRAGKTVQGGSTLTQQLVKNFFLTNERTVRRKAVEALMAILVDWHYGKKQILEAYCNEIYLGQDGSRAIHGFGLASRFYFGRRVSELTLHHVALLVGLITGPSKYDPRRYPEQARERRALVLDIMVERGLIGREDAEIAKQMPLDVSADPPSGVTQYPAFVDLVHRQLRAHYRQADLTSEGLQVFSTLDLRVQAVTEEAIQKRLPSLERSRRRTQSLQAAAVVVDTPTGEVLAVVGDRDVRLAGFNRALDAQRPAGSLLKPAVYLAALENPDRYTLATLLNDNPVVYTEAGGKPWAPKNYDKRLHGRMMLEDALANSYNIPTARLGLDLDVITIVETLERLGIRRNPPLEPYPSLLLGAVDLSPLEIAQMYETFANNGFRTPLRAILAVTSADGKPKERSDYELKVEQVIEPGPAYLITTAMQRVVQAGTASIVKKKFPPSLGIAGKTGTTDDYRDSWFAGFSGNRLTVVWVGRDDNKPIGLSGSQGALPVWMEIMAGLDLKPLEPSPPPEVETVLIDPRSGLRAGRACRGARELPFLQGSVPHATASCAPIVRYVRDDDGSSEEPAAGYAPSPAPDPYPAADRPPASAWQRSDSIDNFFRRLQE